MNISTSITFDDKSSSVHLDGVLKRHQNIPDTRVIPQTPFVRTPYATQKRGVIEDDSVGVRGFAGEAGVSGWRPETPTGLSGDGL